jgi:signal transduction histidine kinase
MRDIPGENTPENIQAIIEETERLSELVNDLLDLSKIESGVKKASPERFDLTDAVHSVISRYDKMKTSQGYNIDFSYEENIDVVADKTMILQVIYNLMNNAINYCGDDMYVGVLQEIKTDKNGERVVRISVIDHGQGISEDQLPLIWDRYYKVDGVHRRSAVGTGIGLSIVKKLLSKHQASYGVESTLGEGSVFWFELRIA